MMLFPRKKDSYFGDNLRLQDFSVIRELGEGTFGSVKLFKHTATQKEYAIKCVDISRGRKKISLEHVLMTTRNQLQILYKLDSPYVITLFDHFQNGNYIYLVMENLGDVSLFLMTYEAKVALQPPHAAQILLDILEGLQHLHSHGIIHRDLKLENVMVKDMRAKIIDLGCANYYGENHIRRTLVGTKVYNSPQLIADQVQNNKLDIWSVGVMLYEILFLSAPFLDAKKTQAHDYKLPSSNADKELQDLFRRIFTKKQTRLSAQQCREHAWFRKHCPKAFIKPFQVEDALQETEVKNYKHQLQIAMDYFKDSTIKAKGRIVNLRLILEQMN